MLYLQEKLAAIDGVESGVKRTVVAIKYDITKSTLMVTMKGKDKI